MYHTAEDFVVSCCGVTKATATSTETKRGRELRIARMGDANATQKRSNHQFCETIHAIPATATNTMRNSGVIGAQPF